MVLRLWYDKDLVAKSFYIIFQTCFLPKLILFWATVQLCDVEVRGKKESSSPENGLFESDWKYLIGHKQGESFAEMSLNFPMTSLIFA